MVVLKSTAKLKMKTVKFSKSRFKTYFGNMGEMIAEEVLLKDGYAVWEVSHYPGGYLPSEYRIAKSLLEYLRYMYQRKPDKNTLKKEYKIRYFNLSPEKFTVPSWNEYYTNIVTNYERVIAELRNFFGDKLEGFKRYVESLRIIDKISIADASRIAENERESSPVYTPDLVAKKDHDIYIVEVKTNSGSIYLKKEKLEGLLSARKFNLIPLLVNLNVKISATNLTIQELQIR